MPPEDWQGLEAVAIDEVSPTVFTETAERLRSSPPTFLARVTRESELDALWTLVDLLLAHAQSEDSASTRQWLPRATVEDLAHSRFELVL